MRNYTKFYITAKGEKFIKTGHVWVFGEEVTKVEGDYQNGDIVDVLSPKGKYIGSGFVNDNSKIRVRKFHTFLETMQLHWSRMKLQSIQKGLFLSLKNYLVCIA